MTSRRLDLHVSALSDTEYKLYTSSLLDITSEDGKTRDDAYLENLSLSVREARAWLRGRYSHLPATTLDNILRFFSPNLSQTDMLSGGQFFAALRLVVHAESGKEVDRTLAFVQAHPSSHPVSRPGSPSKPQEISPIAPSGSSQKVSDSNPFFSPPHSNNPFSSAQSTSAKSHDGSSDSPPLKLPPLPPRKPSFQPPPRHGSFVASTGGNLPPPPPPKPALHSHSSHVAHMTSTLMKQSLIASKTGKTMKQAEEQLEKERVLKVLKSSEGSSSLHLPTRELEALVQINLAPPHLPPSITSESDASRDRAPPLPKAQQKTSFAANVYDLLPANAPRYANSPSTSPSRKTTDLPPLPSGPPPKHPNQSSNLAYRKPPPPIPPNLAQLRNSNDPTDTDKQDFESVYGSVAKSASPYVSSFSRGASEFTPTRADSSEYFNGNANSENSPSPGRMFRSKSLHHPSPPSLASRLAAVDSDDVERSPFSPVGDETTPFASPGPSPRRKRPESVQVLGSKANGLGVNWNSQKATGLGGSSPSTSSNLSRHMSLSTPSPPNAAAALLRQQQHQHQHQRKPSSSGIGSSPSISDNPLKSLAASLQPQLSSMQQQLQPHLDKARYKAEAGLSKRGFVRDPAIRRRRREDEEGLMRDGIGDGWEQSVQDEEYDDDVEDEDQYERRTSRMPRSMNTGGIRSREQSTGKVGIEKDHLKWPVAEGEGWRPL
ncbi:hypothetical protein BT96DRAFT_1012867 [Gymnopus androsaceus JB14]|uniref:Uncharacterized protein n=1 Tax=Gymnopus androsaceus JB14 TaxID=1447944 RepID=A0A6A4IH16_9AGAR|nr:hypothetical protein BT96DRAFT_1012867 [Gymnopus androsaceus JB14]